MTNSTLQLEDRGSSSVQLPRVYYRTAKVEGLALFYREAGSDLAPTVVLLHGFPSSSHMYRNLMEKLADKFYLIELEEGPRMTTNIDAAPESVKVGMPVVVHFDDVTPEQTLVKFKPA